MVRKTGKYKVKYQRVASKDDLKRINAAFDMLFEQMASLGASTSNQVGYCKVI